MQKDGISKKKINAVTVDDIINSPVQNIFGYGSYAETEGEQKFENYAESNRAYAESQKAAAEEGRQMYDENLKKYQSLDSLMKDVEAEHVRFSLKSTESDQEYLDAVKQLGDTDELRNILQTAIKNNTLGKAPNGKQSNLEPAQWLMVRTKQFKDWFGDWEKSYKKQKLINSKPIIFNGNEYKGKYELNSISASNYILNNLRNRKYLNKDTNEEISISRKGAEKVTHHDAESIIHLKSIAYIPKMLENAIFITEKENIKGNNKFDSYRYYVVGLNIGDENYTAKLTIGLKNGKIYYDHSLTKIEKSSLIKSIDSLTSEFANNSTAPIINDKRLLEILQGDSSKVVDENGEPLVVHHGTEAQFNEFDRTKTRANMDIQGNFFSPWEDDAKSYGRNVRKFYIKLNNPATFGQGLKALKIFQGLDKAGEKAANYLIKKGYDGVNNDDEEYIVFDSENIKSAEPVTRDDANNIIPLSERFNPKKKDIRYSLRGNGYLQDKSMSVNARAAYDSGEMPKSKWSKQALLEGLYSVNPNLDISGYKTEVLKEVLLTGAAYHHTSPFYNATNFYKINPKFEKYTQEELTEELDFWKDIIERRPKKDKLQRNRSADDKADEILSKLEFIMKQGTSKYKTFGGLIKAVGNNPNLLDSEFAKAIQKMEETNSRRTVYKEKFEIEKHNKNSKLFKAALELSNTNGSMFSLKSTVAERLMSDLGKALPDSVTYDDEGNVIPLSQRFDQSKKDIRYSLKTIGGEEGWNLTHAVNQKNLVFKQGKFIDFAFTNKKFYVIQNPYYNENIAYSNKEIKIFKSIPIDGNEDLIDFLTELIKNENIQNDETIRRTFKDYTSESRFSLRSNIDASKERRSDERTWYADNRWENNNSGRNNNESYGNSRQASEGTPNRGINTDKQRLSLKKSLQEQYHDQLADAARRIAERQAKVLSDSKKGIKARAANNLDRAEYNWADRRFYLRKWQENI